MISDEKIGVLVKSTLVDYPNHIACALFTFGCQLRCPYCYNHRLFNKSDLPNSVNLNELKKFLIKRKGILNGFVLSGGEPTLSLQYKNILELVNSLGYDIKLDTNGLQPSKIYEVKDLINYLAIDIKTSLEKYHLVGYLGNSVDNILVSLRFNKSKEVRTVLVKDLIEESDIKNISSYLTPNILWRISDLRSEDTYGECKGYDKSEAKELVKLAKELHPNTVYMSETFEP